MAGQIIKRGDKNWMVRIFMGRDGKGKRRYLNKTLRGTKKDAETYLRKTLTEISAGTFVKASPSTVEEYLKKWLETAARPRLRENTYRQYEGLIDRYIKPALGDRLLADVRPLDVQSFYSSLSAKELSPRTVRYTHSVLASALKQAVRWRMLAHNPCDAVELPRKVASEMQSLTPAEAASFLEAAGSDRWYALFSLALATGLRPSEYLGLKWADIDLEQGVLNVQRSLHWRTFKAGDWYFGEPKTPRSRRRIPLPASVVRALTAHRLRQNEARLEAGPEYKNLDLVFATLEGQPLIRLNVVQKHFKPILERAKLPTTLRLYDLRHSCATLLLAANENPKVVSERLGHASITLTMDTYSHVLPDMQQGASDKLERLLFTKTGTQ
ncbi:MAG TPA: tyrosine-type recombinase/integrase [Pyrinomonadaceae bacterium]|nr:tyrosine-type recombinase/integrase [Pyrinomonadaceae bacterium]